MNLTAIYLQLQEKYLRAPDWENFFSLMGALLLKWPILSSRPLSYVQLKSFIKELGISIQEEELESCYGMIASLCVEEKIKDEESGEEKEKFDDKLFKTKSFWKAFLSVKKNNGPVILLSKNLSAKEKLYVMAHELAHYLLGHTVKFNDIDNHVKELHADILAYWLTDIPSPLRTKEENFLIARLVDGKTKEGGNHE